MTNDELWKAALGELELTLSRVNFTTWFKQTFITTTDNGQVVIAVPNTFTKAWFETKYHDAILKALQNLTKGEVQQITYQVTAGKVPAQPTVVSAPVAAATPTKTSTKHAAPTTSLNPRYVFDTFIIGKGNELARAAAVAVGDRPGEVYNPLFIYGEAGLGKTHLMQAIGHVVQQQQPELKVLYVTCEQFTNHFIQAVREGKADDFKKLYRSVDVLLMDDVAFLAGKEQTQEEFFHTFNQLHNAKKQIVLTSDRPPKSIPTLENRLISRFEWGMIVDVGSPDLETRIAILHTKAKERGITLEPDVAHLIATSVHSNIRELEGVLNRLLASAQLKNVTPTAEMVKDILSSMSDRRTVSGLTPKQLILVVSNFFDVTIEDLTGNSRKKELVVPRQIAMYLLREELKTSFPAIGQELGGRDHTTAMHAVEKIAKSLDSNDKLKQDITLIRQRLYAP